MVSQAQKSLHRLGLWCYLLDASFFNLARVALKILRYE